MNRRIILSTGILICLGLFLSIPSWAGEVVTKQDKQWAKKAIQEEGSLKAAPAKNTLAVLYFKNQTEQSELDPLQKGIALLLITDLSKVKSLQVVERVQLQAMVEELGLGISGLVSPETTPRVGRLLGAQWLVGGDILSTKGEIEKLRLQSNLLDVPVQKSLGEPSAEGVWTELFRLEKNLVFELINLLHITATAQEEAQLRIPCSTNTRALSALFKGVDANDRENYARAAEFFEEAIKEDGKICIAKESLQELRVRGLVIGKKKSLDLLHSLHDQTSLTNQLATKVELIRVPPQSSIYTPISIGVTYP